MALGFPNFLFQIYRITGMYIVHRIIKLFIKNLITGCLLNIVFFPHNVVIFPRENPDF